MSTRSRRTQYIILAAALLLIYVLFFSSESTTTNFRQTTESAIARKHGVLRGELSDEALTAQTNRQLQDVLAAKDAGYGSSQLKSKVVLEGSRTERETARAVASEAELDGDDGGKEQVPVAGRKTMPRPSPYQSAYIDQQKPKYPLKDGEEEELNGNKVETAVDEGEQMAREELQGILKRSPIVIFSKSYCPHSKRAKKLLLEQYTITPAPYVVELDLMETKVPGKKDDDGDEAPQLTLGKKVQDLLATLTGRRTVPNIMINAQSLGGADDVYRMEGDGTLVEMVKKMGGKRIVSMEKVDEEAEHDHANKGHKT